jgi:hypothetical protein
MKVVLGSHKSNHSHKEEKLCSIFYLTAPSNLRALEAGWMHKLKSTQTNQPLPLLQRV